jgi:tyrosine-specific transport protein
MSKNFFYAIAVLIGTTIGAGIFGIPYVIAKFGFFPGLFYLIFLGMVTLFLNLFYGEVALRTKKSHHLTGYAEVYFGKKGKYLTFFAIIFGLYGALIAYLIIIGDFLFTIFLPIFAGNPLFFSLIFFALCALAILLDFKIVGWVELLMSFFLILVIIIISFFGFFQINSQNLFTFNPSQFFLPLGVILFALGGALAIPIMEDLLEKEKYFLKKAIIFGTLIPLLVYILFAFISVGVAGKEIGENAILGLEKFLGQKILLLGTIFGILSVTTSFLSIGLALKRIYNLDFNLNKLLSWFLALFLPLFIFLAKITTFIEVISLSGTISMGLSGIIIVLCYLKAKKLGQEKPAYSLNLPKFIPFFIILIFSLGIIYQLIKLIF